MFSCRTTWVQGLHIAALNVWCPVISDATREKHSNVPTYLPRQVDIGGVTMAAQVAFTFDLESSPESFSSKTYDHKARVNHPVRTTVVTSYSCYWYWYWYYACKHELLKFVCLFEILQQQRPAYNGKESHAFCKHPVTVIASKMKPSKA